METKTVSPNAGETLQDANQPETNTPSPTVSGSLSMGFGVVQQYTAVLQEIARRHGKEVPPFSPEQ